MYRYIHFFGKIFLRNSKLFALHMNSCPNFFQQFFIIHNLNLKKTIFAVFPWELVVRVQNVFNLGMK